MRWLAFIILFLLPHPAFAEINYDHFTLKNGLEVYVIPNHRAPVVSQMIWYKVGAIDDPKGRSGIAHFLEHLMFKGTDKHKSGEFSSLITSNGGVENAMTSQDFTAYFQNISRDKLELVMSLEADRMQNLKINEDELLRERNVIIEERRMRVDNNPQEILEEQMLSALYMSYPYGKHPIGFLHEMEGLNLQDAIATYQNYYMPNNAALVIAGDINVEEVKKYAEKYYGVIPAGVAPQRLSLREPPHTAAISITLRDERIKQGNWIRYYLAPSQGYKFEDNTNPYALLLLSKILGGSSVSRLYNSLVVNKKLAANAGTNYGDISFGPAIFEIQVIPKSGITMDQIENAVNKEISILISKGISKDELEGAKNSLIAQTIYAKEGLQSLSYWFGQVVSVGLPASYITDWEKNIKAVTPQEVVNAAKSVLQINHSVTGRLLARKKNV